MLLENDKNAIVDRLMQIVATESVTVETKNGPVEDEVIADRNSLTAAKSLSGLHLKFLKSHNEVEGGVMLNAKDQNVILDRLMRILSKQTVSVRTKDGLADDEVTADKNSIAAAKFVIGLQAKYVKLDNDDADIVRLNEQDEKAIVKRLMQILSKRSVVAYTKQGPFEDRVIADKNAITCANLIMTLQTVGTAGSCASHASASGRAGNGFKIGEPLARCESDGATSIVRPAVDNVLETKTGTDPQGTRPCSGAISDPDRTNPSGGIAIQRDCGNLHQARASKV